MILLATVPSGCKVRWYLPIESRIVPMMYLATHRRLLEAMCGDVATMGGRRSRYWCGLCSGGETKPAVSPDDYQASGALQFFLKRASKRKSDDERGSLTPSSNWRVHVPRSSG